MLAIRDPLAAYRFDQAIFYRAVMEDSERRNAETTPAQPAHVPAGKNTLRMSGGRLFGAFSGVIGDVG